jgi:hypothetical protein
MPDVITITVHMPIGVGTDLKVIKKAAIQQALGHVRTLVQDI